MENNKKGIRKAVKCKDCNSNEWAVFVYRGDIFFSCLRCGHKWDIPFNYAPSEEEADIMISQSREREIKE